jgi:hypothetical protein
MKGALIAKLANRRAASGTETFGFSSRFNYFHVSLLWWLKPTVEEWPVSSRLIDLESLTETWSSSS